MAGYAAHIAADAGKAFVLDHRADIVQHHGADRRRLRGGHEHGDQAATRRSDDGGVLQAAERHEVEHVEHLDRDAVVAPVRIELRQSATAIIERVDGARRIRSPAQRDGEVVKIAAVARQPRQAERRPGVAPGAARRGIAARMQPQTVAGRVV